ncbi:hypothetical protein [Rhodobacter sp. 24-YEA-8]|uniref:hypothetical protein n=1 Tax=Rhodobacter sp. 24-YEA-8 TaxID=1884310 RepID=UPI001495D2FA|nr:hypothetical protein [Rhodobacter sp. 24-YEA-8]
MILNYFTCPLPTPCSIGAHLSTGLSGMSDPAQNNAIWLPDGRTFFGSGRVADANPGLKGAQRSLVRTIVVIALTFAMHTPPKAAITGYSDSAKVIKIILDDRYISTALNDRKISSIEEINQGYRISSDQCHVDVIVTHMIAARPGSTPFTFRIENIKCMP